MFFNQLAIKEASLSYLFDCSSLGRAVVDGDEDWFIDRETTQNVTIIHAIKAQVQLKWLAASMPTQAFER